ncbi:MAG: hypothetical protein EPN22_10360, partial [Nitrospirae bacterium]
MKFSEKSIVYILGVILPLLLVFNHIVPLNGLHRGFDPDDPGVHIWNLFIVNEQIKAGKNPFQTDAVFYPIGGNLAHHGLTSGFFPLTFIVDKATGGDLLYPIYTYHIAIFISFALLFVFSALVLQGLGYKGFSVFIPAVSYSFCNYYTAHVIHLNHIAGFMIPMSAFVMIRLYKKPDAINAFAASLVLAAAVYFTEFSLFIYLTLPLLALTMFALKPCRQELIVKVKEIGLKNLVIAKILFFAAVAPYVANWLFYKGIQPLPLEPLAYSANPIDFFVPRPESTPLYANMFSQINAFISPALTGHETFIGYPLLIAAFLSVCSAGKDIRVRTAVFFAVAFFTLSLGPRLKVLNGITEIHMPYSLLMNVPPFGEFRTPVRFIVVGLFFLMIPAAEGLKSVSGRLTKSLGKRLCFAALTLVFVWAVAESYRPAKKLGPFKVPPQLSFFRCIPQFLFQVHSSGVAPCVRFLAYRFKQNQADIFFL